ncbi:MAG TPA: isochorismatase family cysteine hydrolase [Solirubrobacteraceae bacterium]|nr:isochorismatase family cysteine hydrolase [Solirubrobacteraceae bacterium]
MKPALIITDMLNPYDHADAEPLMESARSVVPRLSELIAQAKERDVVVAYVNDNHGDWTAGRDELAHAAMEGAAPELVEPLLPPPDVPFVVKARHSVFYSTQLEYMLRQFGVTRLVLTGQVTEQCILYSALDAYVRHFEVVVPQDAVAHIHEDLAESALRMMRINMRAETPPSEEALAVAVGAG